MANKPVIRRAPGGGNETAEIRFDANGGYFPDIESDSRSVGTSVWKADANWAMTTDTAVSHAFLMVSDPEGGAALSSLPKPSRSGYSFVGWGTSEKATTVIDPSTKPVDLVSDPNADEKVYLYAIWAPATAASNIFNI